MAVSTEVAVDAIKAKDCGEKQYRVCEMCLRMVMNNGGDVAMLKTPAISKFLKDRVNPTPFLYSYLMKLSEKKKFSISAQTVIAGCVANVHRSRSSAAVESVASSWSTN